MNGKLVLFDCDGTLVDSGSFITAKMLESLAAVGASPPPPELMHGFYSLPTADFFRSLEGHMTREQAETAFERMRELIHSQRSSGEMTEPLFPGLLPVLDGLQQAGCRLGVVTNKAGLGLDLVLRANKIHDRFETLNHVNNAMPKPAPDMVLNAMRDTGVSPADCLVVGDSVLDVLTARAAGVDVIAVTWAGRDECGLRDSKPWALVHQVDDLLPVIRRYWGAS